MICNYDIEQTITIKVTHGDAARSAQAAVGVYGRGEVDLARW